MTNNTRLSVHSAGHIYRRACRPDFSALFHMETTGIYVKAIIATHELEIYLFAIALLVVSLYQNAQQVI